MLFKEKKLWADESVRPMFRRFLEAGVLVPHELHRSCGQQICVHCGDGFRPHYKKWISDLCYSKGGSLAFLHHLSDNGEPMVFAHQSPVSEFQLGDRGDIRMSTLSRTLGWTIETNQNVEQLRIVHHWPCKEAIHRKLSFEQSIDLVARGKLRIKQQLPGLKVGLELFIDWSSENTIHVIKKENYVEFIRTDSEFSAVYDSWLQHAERVRTLPTLRAMPMDTNTNVKFASA